MTWALALCAAETMAFDTSALRIEWLCISVGIASQHRDRNQSVCNMLVLMGSMLGISL
jgi:hypothetical protein